ncbi:hypothetical protein CBS101457_006313 [Exobasidium rhododendri]|nr:hypothetical protein CBS101457_006313 [Exobasidium rhododendri]
MLRISPLRCLSSLSLRPSIATSSRHKLAPLAHRIHRRTFASSVVWAEEHQGQTTASISSDAWDAKGKAKEGACDLDGDAAGEEAVGEHAVLSTFDLFSIGIGPSSSHTVGPMRAGAIFANDLNEAGLLHKVEKIRISIYGSLAATGEGHMTPSALLLGLEGADCETIEPKSVPDRFNSIRVNKSLQLGGGGKEGKRIAFDYERDFIFEYGRSLPLHSNGMRLTVFDKEGTMLATNDLFSVGGGFVINGALSTAASNKEKLPTSTHPVDLAENLFYKEIKRSDAPADRRTGIDPHQMDTPDIAGLLSDGGSSSSSSSSSSSRDMEMSANSTDQDDTSLPAKTTISTQPPYPFRDAKSLLALCRKHNLTIAQLVYENERHWYTDEEIRRKLTNIWLVMDNCIREGVHSEQELLPGTLKMKRRAPGLYRRLSRGLYSSLGKTSSLSLNRASGSGSTSASSLIKSESRSEGGEKRLSIKSAKGPPRVHGSFQHPILPTPPRRNVFPTMDHLTVYAMAVNEENAAGGRIVTAPTNGAAGIIPAVLKYIVEFISDDEESDVFTFLLTAAALAMLYKRGATISAAEGGCMAEVGVACSMAAGAFSACMGATPEIIEQAAEIGIEHNLGLTCDPVGGYVMAPCIERNGIGAVKAVVSANLAMSSPGGKISLDDAIKAMKVTAQGMRNEFKETSMSGLATSVQIPVSVPDC